MADTKFTPGPWAMEENPYGDEIDVYPLKDGPPDVGRWCELASVKDDYDEYRANAHLIAAAPELYEMLAQTAEYFSDADGLEEDEYIYRQNVRAALAKARGEAV